MSVCVCILVLVYRSRVFLHVYHLYYNDSVVVVKYHYRNEHFRSAVLERNFRFQTVG